MTVQIFWSSCLTHSSKHRGLRRTSPNLAEARVSAPGNTRPSSSTHYSAPRCCRSSAVWVSVTVLDDCMERGDSSHRINWLCSLSERQVVARTMSRLRCTGHVGCSYHSHKSIHALIHLLLINCLLVSHQVHSPSCSPIKLVAGLVLWGWGGARSRVLDLEFL